MLAGIIIALLDDSADSIAGRFTAFVQRTKTFQVDLDVKAGPTYTPGSGRLRLAKPNRVYFAMKFGASDYLYGANDDEVVEIEKYLRTYYEHYPLEAIYAPLGKISMTPERTFPAVFLGGLREMMPPGAKFSTGEKVNVQGELADHLIGSVGPSKLDAYIAPDGRLLRLNMDITTDVGDRIVLNTEFKNYVVDKPYAKADYRVDIPIGYAPANLPKDAYTWSADEPFPTSWTEVGGGAADLKTLSDAKPFFAVATVPDCPPSVKAASQVSAVGSQLKLPIYVISLDKSGSVPMEYASYRRFHDPAGRAWQKLGAPGTPLFYLVGGDGKVIRTWYGFDEEKSDLAAKVKSALSGSATDR